MFVSIHQQLHGYRRGHQLLESSVHLDPKDQDLIDYLSDISGPLRPNERFGGYITSYPLPSRKYYALARTEQDLNAPRAGCVITKTLLVPMDFWENEAWPGNLPLLFNSPTNVGSVSIPIGLKVPVLPPLDNLVLSELVEALFLEKRQAIVVFGAPNPVEITVRLLTSFFPDMRSNFSLCTFSLTPRILEVRSFDLQFAPKSVRSRFSDWEGRRIETAPKKTGDRHRWTSVLTHRIFRATVPHLGNPASLKILVNPREKKNEGILRVSLLWDELYEAALKSPPAVLGLIDIANSRGDTTSIWNVLRPVVANAVITAANSLESKIALGFLTTLLEKLDPQPPMEEITQSLRTAGIELAQRDWDTALSYLGHQAHFDSQNEKTLAQSMATSIATVEEGKLTTALLAIPPVRLVQMASLDDGILSSIFSAKDPTTDAILIQNITEGFRSLEAHERDLQRVRFLSCIRGDKDSALLAEIIRVADVCELVQTVDLIWGNEACRTPHLGKILCSAATEDRKKLQVCSAFARLSDDMETNRCIERLLVLDFADVEWLLKNKNMGNRRLRFLSNLIEQSNPEEIQGVFGSERIAKKALHLLASNLKQFASAAGSIALLPSIPTKDLTDVGPKIFRMLSEDKKPGIAQSLIMRIFSDGTVRDMNLAERILTDMIEHIDLSKVITIGLGRNLDGQQISRNLMAFDRVSPQVRTLLQVKVLQMVELLANRSIFDLTNNGATALARLIESAAEFDRQTYVKICSIILPFAFSSPLKPASKVVVVTFPTVYGELRKARPDSGLTKIFKFVDWDKCKVARKKLVHAFLASKWPPVDLAIIGFRACELEKILKRLVKEPQGPRYLTQIEKGAQLLDEINRQPILRAIDRLRI